MNARELTFDHCDEMRVMRVLTRCVDVGASIDAITLKTAYILAPIACINGLRTLTLMALINRINGLRTLTLSQRCGYLPGYQPDGESMLRTVVRTVVKATSARLELNPDAELSRIRIRIHVIIRDWFYTPADYPVTPDVSELIKVVRATRIHAHGINEVGEPCVKLVDGVLMTLRSDNWIFETHPNQLYHVELHAHTHSIHWARVMEIMRTESDGQIAVDVNFFASDIHHVQVQLRWVTELVSAVSPPVLRLTYDVVSRRPEDPRDPFQFHAPLDNTRPFISIANYPADHVAQLTAAVQTELENHADLCDWFPDIDKFL